ncbi:MAG: endolytic transglycosylase MltG [Firmicutes bacterium HGW-Firmicutes-14]|nr:MAG: endolytic transglycosylase MltG [Firmicutes bacterium HGW-Firmicutes-14]
MGNNTATVKNGTGIRQKFIIVLVLLLVVAAAGGLVAYTYFNGLLDPVGEPDKIVEKTVVIPKGANSGQIGRILANHGLIRNETAFRIYTRYRGMDNSLKAGEYRLDTSLSVPGIIDRLARGETATFTFTIPEGFSLKQIVDKLSAQKIIDRDRFVELVSSGEFDYDFLRGLPERPDRLEGYLFPDTYRITGETTENQIIDMMLARFAREITPEFKSGAAELGLSLHQAVTLASLIEREAQKDEERPKVAAVFLNRLKKGWKLESCATIQYILGEPKARLLNKDLEIESPYNTYLNKGLPPGPIASPGGPSLRAAVSPADVDYMFFVVSEDGKHIFSRTLSEHNRNKAVYLNSLKTQ